VDRRPFKRTVYDALSFAPGFQEFLRGPFREFLKRPFTDRAILSILDSPLIHLAYGLSKRDRIDLGRAMVRIHSRIHSTNVWEWLLFVSMKILACPPPPELPGDLIECGTYKGGSAASLSLLCRIVGRKLKVYDSFQGLPPARLGDRQASYFQTGEYCGTLEEVRQNISRYGAIECCDFVEGWFEDTLPGLNSPVLAAFIDVVQEDSLDTCVRHIWPNLTEEGYIFLAECGEMDYLALFWSEKWWRKHFNRTPPGLAGGRAESFGYTMKSMSGYWSYYPDEEVRCD
jgi:hypothetical protein